MDAKKAVHKHEQAMHPGKPLTKFAKGGKTNLQMKQLGRNLAKVANQMKPMRRTRMTGV
jgi:hypothetical protein